MDISMMYISSDGTPERTHLTEYSAEMHEHNGKLWRRVGVSTRERVVMFMEQATLPSQVDDVWARCLMRIITEA